MPQEECKRCGRCCIVIPEVRLTKEEAEAKIYMSVYQPSRKRTVLMRRQFFNLEFTKSMYCCIYFDRYMNLCTIYDKRPEACRAFNCSDGKHSCKVHKIWKGIKEGVKAQCLTK